MRNWLPQQAVTVKGDQASKAFLEFLQGLSAGETTLVTTASFDPSTLVTEAEGIAANDNDTTIPTSAAVKAYADNATGPVKAWVNFNGVSAAGTYSRTGTLVTVTLTGHGMTTGMVANLDFTSGTATDGTYTVTVTGANTFTVVDAASGSTSGNVTRNLFIRGSFNVSSITDNGAGDYTINFTSALADANYVPTGNAKQDASTGVGAGAAVLNCGASVLTTASVRMHVVSGTTGVDAANVFVSVVK